MKNIPRGVVHNAFYRRNRRANTDQTLWGRVQADNIEMFVYPEDENGNIVISEEGNN